MFGGSAARTLKGISEGLDAVGAWAAEADKNNADAFLLKTQTNAKAQRMDREMGWSAAPFDENGVANPHHALGAKANRAWADSQIDDFDINLDKVKSSDEYKALGASNQFAIDKWVASEKNAHRGKVMEHWKTQSSVDYASGIDSAAQLYGDAFVANAYNPAQANTEASRMVSIVVGGLRSIQGYKANDVRTAAKVVPLIDKAVTTAIDTIVNNTSDPNAAENAKTFLSVNGVIKVDGVAFSVSPETRKALEEKIRVTGEGAKARTIGDDLFTAHGENDSAAYDALKAQKLPEKLLDDAHSQYKNRLANFRTNRTAIRNEQAYQASVTAGKGLTVSPAILNSLTGPQRQAVEAEINYRQQVASGGKVTTNLTKQREWMGMPQAAQAKVTKADLFNNYLTHMTPDDGNTVLKEWQDANEAEGTLSVTEQRLRVKADLGEQGRSAKAFKGMVDARLTAILGDTGDKKQKAAMKYVLLREFNQRNVDKAMTSEETEAFINSATTRLLLDPDANFDTDASFVAMTGGLFTDEKGKSITGFTEVPGALGQVPAADRFDLVNWYIKTKGIQPSTPGEDPNLKIADLNNFINTNYLVDAGIVKGLNGGREYAQIKQEIARAGLVETPDLVVQIYQKAIIRDKGR
tara:strand:- start:12054 stop:13964 length:1911 start_codon:yes stop_codon:yes gene_type:complete